MKSAAELLASLPEPKAKKQGKKSRKHRRNYRWVDPGNEKSTEHSFTKYRLRHGLTNR